MSTNSTGANVVSADQAPPAGRAVPDRGAATRGALLAAARAVFIGEGYAQAGVTDIVARAGASVGGLYHHFSGKAGLYLALYDELQKDAVERTRSAVRSAREAGVTDPMVLFLVGARGYLDVSIEQRDLAGVFARGDGPPGFEEVWQRRLLDWVSTNTEFFARSGEPLDEAVGIVMTGAMLLAVSEVARAPDSRRARQIADGVITVLSRLETPPGARPEPGALKDGEPGVLKDGEPGVLKDGVPGDQNGVPGDRSESPR